MSAGEGGGCRTCCCAQPVARDGSYTGFETIPPPCSFSFCHMSAAGVTCPGDAYRHMLCPALSRLSSTPLSPLIHQFDGIIIINAAGIIMMINGVSGNDEKCWICG